MAPPNRLANLNAQDIAREEAAERRSLSALHKPMGEEFHRRLSDEELMTLENDEGMGSFEVEPDIVPDGFVYQWHRTEVFGQPDHKSITNAERNGWKAVPASRHPGRWMPTGYEGPIIVEGQQLMELPENAAYNRARKLYLRAKAQKQAGAEMLGQAPQGTGPRSHPGVKPTVRTSMERLPVEV